MENLYKIEPISLSNNEIGVDINDRLGTIDKNFNKIITSDFLKGSDGAPVIFIDVNIDEDNNEIIYYKGEYDDEKPVIYKELNINHELSPSKLYELIKTCISKDVNANATKAIGGINWYDNLGKPGYDTITLLCQDCGDNYLLKGLMPYVYNDARFADISNQSSNAYEDIDNLSCILIYQNNNFEKINNNPKIYYDNDSGEFCWEINNTKTGLIARGPRGINGESISNYILKIKGVDGKDNVYNITEILQKSGNSTNWYKYKERDNGDPVGEFQNTEIILSLSENGSCICILEDDNNSLGLGILIKNNDNDSDNNYWQVWADPNSTIYDIANNVSFVEGFKTIGLSGSELPGLYIPTDTYNNNNKSQSGHVLWNDNGNLSIGLFDDVYKDSLNNADKEASLNILYKYINGDLYFNGDITGKNIINSIKGIDYNELYDLYSGKKLQPGQLYKFNYKLCIPFHKDNISKRDGYRYACPIGEDWKNNNGFIIIKALSENKLDTNAIYINSSGVYNITYDITKLSSSYIFPCFEYDDIEYIMYDHGYSYIHDASLSTCKYCWISVDAYDRNKGLLNDYTSNLQHNIIFTDSYENPTQAYIIKNRTTITFNESNTNIIEYNPNAVDITSSILISDKIGDYYTGAIIKMSDVRGNEAPYDFVNMRFFYKSDEDNIESKYYNTFNKGKNSYFSNFSDNKIKKYYSIHTADILMNQLNTNKFRIILQADSLFNNVLYNGDIVMISNKSQLSYIQDNIIGFDNSINAVNINRFRCCNVGNRNNIDIYRNNYFICEPDETWRNKEYSEIESLNIGNDNKIQILGCRKSGNDLSVNNIIGNNNLGKIIILGSNNNVDNCNNIVLIGDNNKLYKTTNTIINGVDNNINNTDYLTAMGGDSDKEVYIHTYHYTTPTSSNTSNPTPGLVTELVSPDYGESKKRDYFDCTADRDYITEIFNNILKPNDIDESTFEFEKPTLENNNINYVLYYKPYTFTNCNFEYVSDLCFMIDRGSEKSNIQNLNIYGSPDNLFGFKYNKNTDYGYIERGDDKIHEDERPCIGILNDSIYTKPIKKDIQSYIFDKYPIESVNMGDIKIYSGMPISQYCMMYMKSNNYKPELHISSEDINSLYFNISNISPNNNLTGIYIQKNNNANIPTLPMIPNWARPEI